MTKTIEGKVSGKNINSDAGYRYRNYISIKVSEGRHIHISQYSCPLDIEHDIKKGDHIKITFEVN